MVDHSNGSENHPWYKSYQDNVPKNVNTSEYSCIVDLLDQTFKKYSSLPAFTNMGTTLSYDQIDNLSSSFASYLQNELKLQKGARVAIMMPNILQYPIAIFGILKAGMVVVGVNPLYTARELQHQLNDSGAEAIIIFENALNTLEQIIGQTPVKFVISTTIGGMLKFPKSIIVDFVIKKIKKMVPSYSLVPHIKFTKSLEIGARSNFKKYDVKLSDPAFLQYTGGTTGVAKGAILTHKNILANMIQARAWIGPLIVEKQEIIMTPLPLYHIFSLTANCLVFSSVGSLNVLITNPRDLKSFIADMKKYKFSVITGVNTLFNGLNNHKDFLNLDFSHLKIALGGGMAVQKKVADEWKRITGQPIIEAYGLTETSPAVCMNRMDLKEFNGFIGLPICSTIVAIKNDNEETLPLNEVGEICVKGDQVMAGYWNRPEETAKVMTRDGYFKTGDLGFMNDDGYVKIVDRKKDMIIVSGFNVYPNEVEEVAVMHEKVLEAAVIGVPDEKTSEAIKLFVVKKDNSLTESELLEFMKDKLTNYKRPKYIVFKNELPKTNVGKILRRALRD